jgi:cytochrome c-type biogenesis protein
MIPTQPENSARSKRTLVLLAVIVGGVGLLALALSFGAAEATLGTSMLALIPAAFISGVLSFLSPCSLPILPAYFAFSFQTNKKNIVMMTLAFFAGLATTMTLLGASVTAVGRLLVRNFQRRGRDSNPR